MSERLVGPVLSSQEMFEAVLDAAEVDNPGARLTVEDRGGYYRIQAPRHLRLTRQSLEDALGREFNLSDLEPNLSSFSGRTRFEGEEEMVFYLERED